MNQTLERGGALCNVIAVAIFAASMLFGFHGGSYAASMFIAIGFVLMMCGFFRRAHPERKTAAAAGPAFGCIYSAIVFVVYFTQLTAVLPGDLGDEAEALLDFQRYGLFFHYDLLGYAMMSLATFFAGLSLAPNTQADHWLRRLLLIHGVFFIPCLVLPITGTFSRMEDAVGIGTALLEGWCLYFLMVGLLTFRYFAKDVNE